MLLSGDDTRNLEAALLAREMNPDVRVVLRMSSKGVLHRLDGLFRRGAVRNFHLVDSVAGAAPKCVELARLSLADGTGVARCRPTATAACRDVDAADARADDPSADAGGVGHGRRPGRPGRARDRVRARAARVRGGRAAQGAGAAGGDRPRRAACTTPTTRRWWPSRSSRSCGAT